MDISLDKVCYLIMKVRAFEVKVAPSEENSGSNPIDDLDLEILEDLEDDPTYDELVAFFEDLNEDEALDLVTLMWIGRGTYGVGEWQEARDLARKEATHTTAEYLLGTPLLSEYLQNGLDAFGLSCQEAETIHL